MIVFDSGQFFWNWDVEVIGLDVDQAALEKARRGVYQHNSFRALPPEREGAALRARRPRQLPGQGADPPPGELRGAAT